MSEKKVKRKIISTLPDKGIHSSQNSKNAVLDSFLLEEEEALKRDGLKDLNLFKSTASKIKEALKQILMLKESDGNEDKIEQHRVEVCLHFLVLKKLNRLDKHRLKHTKDAVAEAKQKVDNYHLQLQNLQYEVMHLQKEASKCMDFKSKDEDIDLVPLTEFYEEAPERISRPNICKADSHQETLARLEWELAQRKRLAQDLTNMEARKKRLLQDIAKKKEAYNKILPTLKNILEATRPLHTELGMPLQATHLDHQGAELLPRPLYVLYVHLLAYKEAADPLIAASIEGNQEEARLLLSNQSNSEEESGDSDQEDTQGNRHRRSEKHHNQEASKTVLAKHPLSILLSLKTKDGKSCLTLELAYLLQLQVVTVHVVSLTSPSAGHGTSGDILRGDRLLHHLLEPDDGASSPNPASKYVLKKHGIAKDSWVDMEKTGLPYRWAQKLAGLEFLTPFSQEVVIEKSEAYIAVAIAALHFRLESRLVLCQQIASLERNVLPIPTPAPSYLPPHSKILGSLRSWVPASWENLQKEPPWQAAKRLLELKLIDPSDFIFSLVLERGSAHLHATVVIPLEYPNRTPIFLLALHWQSIRYAHTDTALWELEQNVNLLPTNEDPKQVNILSKQILALATGLDVYLEREGDSTVEGPREFPPTRTFLRHARGPGRSPPYHYLPLLGVFAHQ